MGVAPRGQKVGMAAAAAEEGDFLQRFWQLSSDDEEERIGAARDLLLTLQKKQVRAHTAYKSFVHSSVWTIKYTCPE